MNGDVSVPFNVAVRLGHVEVARRLLADPRLVLGPHPGTALVLAASRGHAAVVELLLADPRFHPVDSIPRERFTTVWQQIEAGGRSGEPHDDAFPLAAAAEGGHLAVVDLLMADLRVDPLLCCNTALENAVCKGPAVVRRLLADPRVREHSASGHILLKAAALVGDVELIGRLMGRGHGDACDDVDSDVDLSEDEYAVPRAAAAAGQLDALRLLLAHPSLDRAAAISAIMSREGGGDAAALDLMLTRYCADAATHGNLPLTIAAQKGRAAAVQRLLLESEVNPLAFDSRALRAAAANGRTAVVEVLMRHRSADRSVAAHGVRALMAAAQEGHLPVVQLLLQHPMLDISAWDEDEESGESFSSATEAAAKWGHHDCVEALLADDRILAAVEPSELLMHVQTVSAVQRLLDAPGADPSPAISHLLRLAARKNCTELQEQLLRICDAAALTAEVLERAAEECGAAGSEACLASLLAHPTAHVPAVLCAALNGAAANHHMHLVHRLIHDPRLEPGLGLEAALATVLLCAARRSDAPLLARVLADDRCGRGERTALALHSAMCEAAALGRLPVLDLLLADPRTSLVQETADMCMFQRSVHMRKPWSAAVLRRLLEHPQAAPCPPVFQSPLELAAAHGDLACVDALLADPRVRDALSTGRFFAGQLLVDAPAAYAARHGHVHVLQRLLADPVVDPRRRRRGLRSPLLEAAIHGHAAIIEVLLGDPRVDPSSPAESAALRFAAAAGELAAVERLLADPRIFADALAATTADGADSDAAAAGITAIDALDCAIGREDSDAAAFAHHEQRSLPVAGDRLAVCGRLLLETNLLHARLGREDGMRDVSRLGIHVAGLGRRAWVRRRAVIAARQRALDGADAGSEVE